MAGIGSTVAAADYIVKTVYKGPQVRLLNQRNKPFFNKRTKKNELYGKQVERPVSFADAAGVSNTFASAQTAVAVHQGVRWQITRKVKYGYYTLDAEVLHATKKDEAAFVREVRFAMDSLLRQMGKMSAIDLWGNGEGTLGEVSAISANVITLKNKVHTYRFSKKMKLEIWSAETGGTQRTGTAEVTAVDKVNGKVTIDATPTGTAANDFIFSLGSRGNAIKGVDSWIPTTDPTSTAFFGVDRTQDLNSLGGYRLSGTAVDIDEGLLEIDSMIQREGGEPDEVWVDPTNFTNLSIKLGSKIERMDDSGPTFGFEFMRMMTPTGAKKVMADPYLGSDKAYIIESESAYIMHMEELPHFADEDGTTLLRQNDSDSLEFRGRQWWQLVVEAPGHSGVLYSLA